MFDFHVLIKEIKTGLQAAPVLDSGLFDLLIEITWGIFSAREEASGFQRRRLLDFRPPLARAYVRAHNDLVSWRVVG